MLNLAMGVVAGRGGPLCAVMLLNFSGHEPLSYVAIWASGSEPI